MNSKAGGHEKPMTVEPHYVATLRQYIERYEQAQSESGSVAHELVGYVEALLRRHDGETGQ